MSEDKQDGRRTRPFADFLAEHNNGQGHREAGETLQELVHAVVDTGKKGSMTVTVTVEPMKGAEGTLVTSVLVAAKVPKLAPKAAIFYADDDGNLQRTDPRQLSFDSLREVEAPKVADAKSVPAPVVRDAAGGAQ